MTDWGGCCREGQKADNTLCVSEQPLPTHSHDTTLHGLTYTLGDPRDLAGWGRTPPHTHLRPQGHPSSTWRLLDLSLSMGSRSQHYPANDAAGTSPEKRGEGSSPSREAKLSPVVFKGIQP